MRMDTVSQELIADLLIVMMQIFQPIPEQQKSATARTTIALAMLAMVQLMKDVSHHQPAQTASRTRTRQELTVAEQYALHAPLCQAHALLLEAQHAISQRSAKAETWSQQMTLISAALAQLHHAQGESLT